MHVRSTEPIATTNARQLNRKDFFILTTNKRTLWFYWQQIRKYKPSFFLALVAIPGGTLLVDTLLPYFLAQAIGGLTSGDSQIVVWHLIIGAAVGIAGALANFTGFLALTHHEAHVRKAITDTSFAQLISKDFQFFTNTKVGALTTRHLDFIRSQVVLQDLFIIRTLGFVMSVGIGLTILFAASPPVAGIILFLLIALILQVRWSIKKRAPWRHERKEIVGKIHGHIADSVTNNLIVKTFAGEKREAKVLKSLTKRFRTIFKKDIGFISIEGSVRVALMVIVQIAAVSYAAYLVFNGQLAVATAIFVLAYLQRIGSQLFTLGDILNGYDQALLDAAPMSDMLNQPLSVKDKSNAKKLKVTRPIVELDNISYRYSDSPNLVLDSLSLTIPAGQKVGLVGPSGAGKSTLTHLLLRFSDVTGGAIRIDGHDIRDVTQESLRTNIAYVPQEPMLFHRTLRENIAYGKPNATIEEIERAAMQANALDFIKELPQGIDTIVGERGVKLSGGQRQRIAISRALLKDAPILILDEATSALDSESEKLIQASLETLMEGRTSIVIAHRLSTIAKLDRIIVLENGKVIEDGPHSSLLRQGGTYARLWKHQSGGFIEE